MGLMESSGLDAGDDALARRYAPIVRFDTAEPFLPTFVGYTLFRAPGVSPSFPRLILLEPPAAVAIEYALWWDWDIQHLYELEHVWVFVDATGTIVGVEGSQHGSASGDHWDLDDGRPVMYAEAGKHALTSTSAELAVRRIGTERACGQRAGTGGVWVTPLYHGRIAKTPDADQLVRTYLRGFAFTPRWEWSQRVNVVELPLIPWSLLDRAIPGIVAGRVAELDALIQREKRHVLHIGHRGAGVHAPPNTLAAIDKAAELGAHMVELDVRLSADGIAVLAHDASVAHVDQSSMPVSALTASEFRQSVANAETAVPTLKDALDHCERLGLGAYLELKEMAAADRVVIELAGRDLARHCIVGAFNPAWVARVTERAPHIATSVLFGAVHIDPVTLARGAGARYVHPCWESHPAPDTLLTTEWIGRARQAGLGIICWHEERPSVLAGLLKVGVSGICTDRLDLLAEAARKRDLA